MHINKDQQRLVTRKGKICVSCSQDRVLDDFVSGSGSNLKMDLECNECRGMESREKEVIERERRAAKLAKKVITSARAAKYDGVKVYEFAGEMIEQFGGLKSTCVQWKSQIDKACQSENPKHALDAFYAIFKMHVESGKEIAMQTDVSGMSDDELSGELKRILAEEMKEIALYDEGEDVA